jgi:hypothetical protein
MNLLGDRKKENKKRNRSWGVKTSKPFLCKKANSLELDVISEGQLRAQGPLYFVLEADSAGAPSS